MPPGGVAGAVLTGGASRRMGRDKATLPVDGVAMALRVAGALARAGCTPVFGVGGQVAPLAALGLDVVDDAWPGEGPVGGVIVALEHADGDVLVAACDLPWLDEGAIGAVLRVAREHPDADVVHASSGRPEPLCAVWRQRATPLLRERFAAGVRAVHEAVAGLRVVDCPVDPRAMTNVNSPADLRRPPV